MRRVVVLGSGRMAPGIAAACSAAGAAVTIVGRDPERAAEAAGTASSLADAPVAYAPFVAASFFAAELLIETVVEDAAVKAELLGVAEGWLTDEAVMATNTSSLSIEMLAEAVRCRDRFAGFHFLNPAHLTAVVEVVPGPATSPITVERLVEFATRMDKRPLVLRRDVPGFVWNRIQFAVLRECLHMLQQGVADAATIDSAVSDGLAPRWLATGPLATVDLGGVDTFRRAAQGLFPELASGLAGAEELSGRAERDEGFYRWTPSLVAAVESLRAEALGVGRQLADRRRAAAPAE